MNDGREPVGSVMLKEFSGKASKTPRGLLRSLRVSSLALVMVVVTFKFSNPWILGLEVEVQTIKPGVAEIAIAEVTRATREQRREEENIVKTFEEMAAIDSGTEGPGFWQVRSVVDIGTS